MKKTMSKETQQKIVLIVIVYVIAFVIFNNLFLDGINKKTKDINNRIKTKKLEYTEGLNKVANISVMKAKYEEKKKEYEEKKKAFITENEKKVILKEIEEAGKRNNVKIEVISLMKAEPAITTKLNCEPVVDNEGRLIDMTKYKEYRINMILKSGYSEITEFIKEIEALEKLVLVQEMNLKSDGKEITTNLLLKCYIIEK